MGQRGPSKKPASLKVVAGTDRPDRAADPGVDLPLVEGTPMAPDWLPNAHAIKEWDRLAPILTANKLLTEAGTSALGVLCSIHGQLVDLWSRRNDPPASLLSQYRGMVNDFGLTPVAQGKVKPVGEKEGGNRFGNNGKRPT
jgi:phage terminase small subunit